MSQLTGNILDILSFRMLFMHNHLSELFFIVFGIRFSLSPIKVIKLNAKYLIDCYNRDGILDIAMID